MTTITHRRSSALLAMSALAIGTLTAACDDGGDGVDDTVEHQVEDDVNSAVDEVESGVDAVQDEVESGVDAVQDEIDTDTDSSDG